MSRQAQRLIGVTMVTASLLAVAPADVILEYDTGHPLGPHFLTLDEESPLEISVTDRTGEQWGIGAVIFDFVTPDGGLGWNLNGTDDIDFTEDDDFVWPCYFYVQCSGFYGAQIDPTVTEYFGHDPLDAVWVSPNGTVLLGALTVGPNELGDFTLNAEHLEKGVMFLVETFVEMIVEDGTEEVILTVLPRADGDGDSDIDLVDFALFQICFTGSGRSDVEGVCTLFDFDSDNDVDLDDFAVFRDAVTGPYA